MKELEGKREVNPHVLVTVVSDHLNAVKNRENGDKESTVPIVGHPPSIVTLAGQVGQCLQR